MLRITIPEQEFYDEKNNSFFTQPACELCLEHSLHSISKWESRHCKPFLSDTEKRTYAETMDYIRCMITDEKEAAHFAGALPYFLLKEINEYIDSPMTATTFSDNKSGGKKQIITAEIIYYRMISPGIPFECQYRHLNRLLTLIRVCSIKNSPGKKMSQKERNSRNRALNAARCRRFNSKG